MSWPEQSAYLKPTENVHTDDRKFTAKFVNMAKMTLIEKERIAIPI